MPDKLKLAPIVRKCKLPTTQHRYFKRDSWSKDGEIVACCALGAIRIELNKTNLEDDIISILRGYDINLEEMIDVDSLPEDVRKRIWPRNGRQRKQVSISTVIMIANDSISRERAADMLEKLVDEREDDEQS